MLKKSINKKLAGIAVGWTAAAVCLAAGILYANNICSRDLSLMLYVNGEPVCQVEDRAVVDEALLMLDEKLEKSGLSSSQEREITYQYVLADSEKKANATECMDLLYSLSSENYARAYMISIDGIKIAACATYAEAEQVVTDLKDYIVQYVLETKSEADVVELTTEFQIDNVFCMADEISSASDIYRIMTNGGSISDFENEDSVSDTRISAIGSSSLLSANKNLFFGLTKNSVIEPLPEDNFSFNVDGFNSAIEYKTYSIEKYSEIISYEIEYIETDELYVGETQVISEGENGIAENEYEIAYADGVEVSRELISSVIISEPKKRVELIGTKAYPSTEPTGAFMWPIQDDFVITSYYGITRPGFDDGSYHYGIDIAGVSIGDPIYAADGGTVTYAGTLGTYGLLVKIQHEDGVATYYAHMSSIDVEVGDKVYKGQKIAEIGMTGVTTGPHLHFEVRINGKTVNPIKYLPK